VLCEDLQRPENADVLAERVVAALAAPFKLSKSAVNVTASVGIAFAGRGDLVPEQVLTDADAAMYQAKRAGGARHQMIDLRERDRAEQRESLERDLRNAVSRGELRLDYQPIVRTVDTQITGVEALLRWDHPQLGLISPEIAIPLAEQSDLIVSVGRWVLERACADATRLQAFDAHRDLQMCVNVSTHQLMAPGWCGVVEETLTTSGTNPASLTLEVTESAYLEDLDRAEVVLDDLKRVGVGIALDDFGTGYSSLGYLQRVLVGGLYAFRDNGLVEGVGEVDDRAHDRCADWLLLEPGDESSINLDDVDRQAPGAVRACELTCPSQQRSEQTAGSPGDAWTPSREPPQNSSPRNASVATWAELAASERVSQRSVAEAVAPASLLTTPTSCPLASARRLQQLQASALRGSGRQSSSAHASPSRTSPSAALKVGWPFSQGTDACRTRGSVSCFVNGRV
jgi:hypothetical protein